MSAAIKDGNAKKVALLLKSGVPADHAGASPAEGSFLELAAITSAAVKLCIGKDTCSADNFWIARRIQSAGVAKSIGKIRQLTIADILAESIRRVSNEESISALFT